MSTRPCLVRRPEEASQELCLEPDPVSASFSSWFCLGHFLDCVRAVSWENGENATLGKFSSGLTAAYGVEPLCERAPRSQGDGPALAACQKFSIIHTLLSD